MRVSRILEELREKSPALVDEFVPHQVKVGQLLKVLKDLLLEGVSIRDIETILESVGGSLAENLRHEMVLREVRRSLSRALANSRLDTDGRLHAIVLDPDRPRLEPPKPSGMREESTPAVDHVFPAVAAGRRVGAVLVRHHPLRSPAATSLEPRLSYPRPARTTL